jgi:hypothetical protein
MPCNVFLRSVSEQCLPDVAGLPTCWPFGAVSSQRSALPWLRVTAVMQAEWPRAMSPPFSSLMRRDRSQDCSDSC